MKKEILKAIKNGTLYDFICNYGYKMSKDDLILLAKECYFAGTCTATKPTHDEYNEELYENVKEYMSDDEEE